MAESKSILNVTKHGVAFEVKQAANKKTRANLATIVTHYLEFYVNGNHVSREDFAVAMQMADFM